MASTSQIKLIKCDNKIDSLLNNKHFSNRKGFLEVGEEKVCLPIYYEDYKEEIDEFEVRNEDVYLCEFPTSGTTRISDVIWLLYNNFDYQTFEDSFHLKRFHQLEFLSLFDLKGCWFARQNYENFEYINIRKSPRFIKTHLHWSLLPQQIQDNTKSPKLIVTLRNSQDTCISYYRWCQNFENYIGTFEEWCQLFLAGRISLGPFWSHVLSYWRERHRPNIMFVKYADIEKDFSTEITRIAKFLDKVVSQEHAKVMAEFLNFVRLKKKSIPTKREAKIDNDEQDTCNLKMSSEILQRFEELNARYLMEENISFE